MCTVTVNCMVTSLYNGLRTDGLSLSYYVNVNLGYFLKSNLGMLICYKVSKSKSSLPQDRSHRLCMSNRRSCMMWSVIRGFLDELGHRNIFPHK